MANSESCSRRELLMTAGIAGAAALTTSGPTEAAEPPAKVFRIGVISAAIDGKPQPRNGHTWHFAQYLHPRFDWDAFKKHSAGIRLVPKVQSQSQVQFRSVAVSQHRDHALLRRRSDRGRAVH